MKEELQLKLAEILTGIQSAVAKGADFAMEQIPDIAMQYVVYGRMSSTLEAVLFVVLFALACYACIKSVRFLWVEERDEGAACFVGFFGGLANFVLLYLSVAAVQSALLVWVAPKVWLLKSLAALVKG